MNFINKIKVFLFLYLLTLFFILNGWVEYHEFIPVSEVLFLLGKYLLLTIFLHLIFYLIYRNLNISAIAAFFTLSIFYFFGSLHDAIKSATGGGFLSRYSILLVVLFLCLATVLIYLKKRQRELFRFSGFLTTVFSIFILVEGIRFLVIKKGENRQRVTTKITSPDYDELPDIYYIIPDEYSNSLTLKQLWNVDQNNLDSYLLKKGFYLIQEAASNYNLTPFSIASTLNMEYLTWLKNPSDCTPVDYNICNVSIRESRALDIFEKAGYKIYNNTVFDIGNLQSPIEESFLPMKTRLLTEQTLISRLIRDLGFHVLSGRFTINWFKSDLFLESNRNNTTLISLTNEAIEDKTTQPKLVLTHLYMPHAPFYYDRHGNLRDKDQVFSETEKSPFPYQPYLDYVFYTNSVLISMIEDIFLKSVRKPIIILLSDHGFRSLPEETSKSYYFKNYAAVYLPDKDYSKFYPNVSNVNIFPLVLNSHFNQKIDLKKDTSIFLSYKK